MAHRSGLAGEERFGGVDVHDGHVTDGKARRRERLADAVGVDRPGKVNWLADAPGQPDAPAAQGSRRLNPRVAQRDQPLELVDPAERQQRRRRAAGSRPQRRDDAALAEHEHSVAGVVRQPHRRIR